MPELPEVETVKNYLKPYFEGDIISESEIINPNLRQKIPHNISKAINGQKITSLTRRAKYIIAELENQSKILFHLGMTGKISHDKNLKAQEKHDHFSLKLKKSGYFTYNDVRKFGLVTYFDKDQNIPFLENLAIEPLCEEFNTKYLQNICQNKNLEIKKLIMDQKYVVGVGNIYAAEALFLSKIHPKKLAKKLSQKNCQDLVKNIKIILENAIKKGGSTIKDYKNAEGGGGYFQQELKVYGRESEPCVDCNSTIEKVTQAGRSSFYCPECQGF